MYLKKRLNFHNFIIIEGEKDVGGTWLVNTYPGAACDVNSHVYAYYENLNPGNISIVNISIITNKNI